MRLNNTLRKLTLALSLVAATAMAQTPYDEGQKALRAQQWMQAANLFEEAFDTPQADAAMYWRAHALYKAGHRGDAARQIKTLERRFPDSNWTREAQALMVEYGGSSQDSIEQDELRLFALSQLMERDLERAMPLVIEIMQNTESDSVRRDALFVLGVSGQPEAQQAIVAYARDSSDPALQMDAIHMLGASANPESLELLKSLYLESNDVPLKTSIIHAFIAADDASPLIEFLGVEQDPGLQREIIHSLGAIGEVASLREIYPTLQDPATKRAAIEALAIAGDTATLREFALNESDPEIRKTAIYGIAMDGGPNASQELREIYATAGSQEEKSIILEAMVILDDGEDLALEVIRTESDPELQGKAIEILGMLGSTQELGELYRNLAGQENRRKVMEAMMIAGDADGLIRILETEQDPDLRAQAIDMLSMTDNEQAAAYLVEMYPGGDEVVKRAVIRSMMIMDNPAGLIRLMEQETDPELRRELLQTLSVMDSDEANEYLFQLLESGS